MRVRVWLLLLVALSCKRTRQDDRQHTRATTTLEPSSSAPSSSASPGPPIVKRPVPELPPEPPCPPTDPTQPVSILHHVHGGDAARVHDIVLQYRCRYPKLTRVVEIGRTHLGRPVLALFIGRDLALYHNKPTMLLNGGHHGAELMSTLFVLDAIGTLLEDPSPATQRVLDELVVVAVPLVNPDGNHLTTHEKLVGRKNGRDLNGDGRRTNAEGVDLNRNYPFRWGALGEKGSSSHGISQYYRGPEPGSEPETRAMMHLANSEHFAGSVSYHTGTIAILAPYTIPGVKSPEPHIAWLVAEHVAKAVVGHPEGGFPVRKNLYPVDGTDQDWLFATHGTLALLIEGVDNGGRSQGTRRLMVNAVRKSWQALFDRFLDGPAVTGHLTDAAGRPVTAQVSIDEVATHDGEVWTSRCRDGRFDRYLPAAGSYTLRIRTQGHEEVVRRFEVTGERGLARVDVSLPQTITPPICPPL